MVGPKFFRPYERNGFVFLKVDAMDMPEHPPSSPQDAEAILADVHEDGDGFNLLAAGIVNESEHPGFFYLKNQISQKKRHVLKNAAGKWKIEIKGHPSKVDKHDTEITLTNIPQEFDGVAQEVQPSDPFVSFDASRKSKRGREQDEGLEDFSLTTKKKRTDFNVLVSLGAAKERSDAFKMPLLDIGSEEYKSYVRNVRKDNEDEAKELGKIAATRKGRYTPPPPSR